MDLNNNSTLANISTIIIQEYERRGQPVDQSAHKLSAVKCKGPDPKNCLQQQGGPPKDTKRGGKQEHAKRKKYACKQQTQQQNHSHSQLLSTATIKEIPSPIVPPLMPTMILASQPSRAAPTHTSVASFGKDGITYRKQATAAQVSSSSKSTSVWLSL
jgi:hypothetical protein